MKTTLRLPAIIIGLTFGLAINGATTPAWSATIDRCHNFFVTGKTASAVKISKAKQRARGKWSKKAVATMGGRSGDWSIARHKSYICSRAGLHYCKAKAVPCLFRKTGSGNNQKKL